ncbi:MAG: hypothetical protein ACH349_01420 [Candidatus Rhabdochlamydia sp.]
MSLSRSARQYMGVRAILPPDLQTATRAPTSSDTAYVKGTLWLDTSNATAYMWPGSGNWISLGSGTTGAIVTLTGGSGGALSPTAGNMNMLGTANQITSTGSGSTITFSIPSTFIAPGTIASTTTITSGTALVATTTLTAGTGITSTTGNIVASAGNISATLGSVAAATTVTAGTDLVSTAGNVLINGSAKQLRVKGGAVTDFIGTATLTNGVATVLNTNIAATDRIFVERSAVNASSALGVFKVVKNAATSFVITACKPADATTETGDASTVEYFIVRQV